MPISPYAKSEYIAIPPLNDLVRAENRERFNAFSATDEADLKVNCYSVYLVSKSLRINH